MNKATILIVEDKEEFRKIYGDSLRFHGFEVLDASDGVEAMKVLGEKKIDLVMTDINMPNKNGYELISEMKANDKLKAIPVIVMSVFGESEHLKKALELGASDYLVKGVKTPNDVAASISKILGKN